MNDADTSQTFAENTQDRFSQCKEKFSSRQTGWTNTIENFDIIIAFMLENETVRKMI